MGSQTTIIIVSISILFLIGITIGLILYFRTSPPKKPTITCEARGPPKKPNIHGLWIKVPKTADEGLTYEGSEAYCKSHSATLSTKEDLLKAQLEKDFDYCTPGWVKGKMAGWVSHSREKECGAPGTFNQVDPPPDINTKYATYCTGTIPQNNEVSACAALEL